MHFTKNSVFLLMGATAVSAIPLDVAAVHRLVARGAKYQPSCDRTIPGSKKTYKEKANAAFSDANTLAQGTQSGTDVNGNAFTESTAYTHYFADKDKDQVKRMMQVIYNSHLPVDNHDGGQGYYFDIHCGSDQDMDTCGSGQSLAGTDARPGKSSMVLCDLFFKSDTKQTKQDIKDKDRNKPGRRGWCNTNEEFPYFEVAGLTMFHEMTHMHDVGQRAKLVARPDPDGYDSSGTVDIYEKGGSDDIAKYKGMEPWQAARQLKRFWDEHDADNNKYKPTQETIYNAESYAAAALEFFFLKECKWDVILPK